jgi:hypothetical protein
VFERIHHCVDARAHPFRIGCGRFDGAEHLPRRIELVGLAWIYAVG